MKSLILIHGLCESASMWQSLTPNLAEHFNVHCFEIPGFGKQKLIDENYSIKDLSKQLHNFISEHKLSNIVLAGHSMGGYVAAEFAANYPSELTGLAMIHSTAYADTEEKKIHRNKVIKLIQKGGKKAFLDMFYQSLFSQKQVKTHKEVINKLNSEGQELSNESIIAALNALKNRNNNVAALAKLSIPIVYFSGRQDSLIPITEQAEQIIQIPKARWIIEPDVAHMGMFENKESFIKAIKLLA